jgi:hypothetical protein
MSEEREFPRGMKREDEALAVIDTAVAYVDQLCSYNAVMHPEVHKQRLRLAEAVDAFHNSASPESEGLNDG